MSVTWQPVSCSTPPYALPTGSKPPGLGSSPPLLLSIGCRSLLHHQDPATACLHPSSSTHSDPVSATLRPLPSGRWLWAQTPSTTLVRSSKLCSSLLSSLSVGNSLRPQTPHRHVWLLEPQGDSSLIGEKTARRTEKVNGCFLEFPLPLWPCQGHVSLS